MQSPVWAQLAADVFDREIEISNTQESGARGIAMLAGVATNTYASIEVAITKCVKIERTVKPNPERAKFFKDRYQQYRDEAKRIIKV